MATSTIDSSISFGSDLEDSYGLSSSFLLTAYTDFDQSGYLGDTGALHMPVDWNEHYVAACRPVIRGSTPSESATSPATPTVPLVEIESSSPGTSIGKQPRSPVQLSKDATVPRSHRFNPLPTAAARKNAAARKKAVKHSDSDDDDDGDDYHEATTPTSTTGIAPVGTGKRNDTVRRQRIESEQRRRDELRDGYLKLKMVLPPSQQKLSKAALLDRATTQVAHLNEVVKRLQQQLHKQDAEVTHLRKLNEKLLLKAVERVPSASTRPF